MYEVGGCVTCMRENRNTFWLKNLKGRDAVEDLSVDGRVMLKLILEKYELDPAGAG
jgi:hypothetical protein